MPVPVEVEEVDHVLEADAVYHVADDTANYEPVAQLDLFFIKFELLSENEYQPENDKANYGQRPRVSRKHGPRRSGVPHVDDVKKVGNDDDGSLFREEGVEFQRGGDPELGCLIEQKNGCCQ